MKPDELPLPSRLDAIATQQSLLQAAHQGSPASMNSARQALVMRYRKAIRRYLGGLLQDDNAADEVAQEVIVKLLQGSFAGVEGAKGRFRDYLKTTVRNASWDYRRRQNPRGQSALDAQLLAEQEADPNSTVDPWLDEWRRNILEQARQALQVYQNEHAGNVYATVLNLLTEHPEDDSEQLAVRLATFTGRLQRADAVRKHISRARRKFAELVVTEIKHTLDDPTHERLEEELIETGLMPYVRDFLSGDEVP